MTFPKKISSTSSEGTLYLSNACRKATIPSSVAVRDLREPLKEPIGVLDAATMTASRGPKVDYRTCVAEVGPSRGWGTYQLAGARNNLPGG